MSDRLAAQTRLLLDAIYEMRFIHLSVDDYCEAVLAVAKAAQIEFPRNDSEAAHDGPAAS